MDQSCFDTVSLDLLVGLYPSEWTNQSHQAGSSDECVSETKKNYFLNFRIGKKKKKA